MQKKSKPLINLFFWYIGGAKAQREKPGKKLNTNHSWDNNSKASCKSQRS